MSRSVDFDPRALDVLRDLKRRDPDEARRIGRAIEQYVQTGHGDAQKLRVPGDWWRLRVGDWRVIFSRQADGRLIIDRILPRKEAYR